MPPTKTFSWDDIKSHNSEKDLWMVIGNNVYDVTSFVDEHPGGVNTLTENGGIDGTSEFDAVGHSASARDSLAKYLVGELSEDAKASKAISAGNEDNTSSIGAIAIVILLMSIVMYFVIKQ